jgi:RNA polymerase sigma-70 factor (ECF subfamily)
VAGLKHIWKSKRRAGFAGLAFEQLRAPLHRYLLNRLRHKHHAEDLEQEVYLRLLKLPNEAVVQKPEAYVYRIASNLVNQFIRRELQGSVDFDSIEFDDLTETVGDDAPAPDEVYDNQAREKQLAIIVRQLPPMQRAVFVLARYEGLAHADIATQLGISPHTVKKHMLRAITRCRDELRKP